MNYTCKKCKKPKPMEQFKHKHYSPKVCLDCRKEMQAANIKSYSDRRNKTKWLDVWIGKN